ncbi:hypothetical protein L0666_16400 [Octadecabacter sp. CECT 8868]|uniref:hypothetical protein n=1 Tax=Octadecabacter algicola TaxID=2909342 RepID=UPI001F3837E3|nr:hypothetical protein [Octadecabacter algicola]MCF2906576.1 hypothetical protein [Octadecabacter algicola]
MKTGYRSIFTFLLVTIGTTGPLAAHPMHSGIDPDITIDRIYSQNDRAVVEFSGQRGTMYHCVIRNQLNTAIATANSIGDRGIIVVDGITAADIAAVFCRKMY